MKSKSLSLSNVLNKVLGLCVLLSATVIMSGLVLAALTGDFNYPQGSISPAWILGGAASLNPSAIVFLGFLILVATPVFRVMVSIFSFYRMKDNVFTIITATVLVVLFVSFLIGAA